MIKKFSASKFQIVGWAAILVIALGAAGCAKKLAPEVETQPEEQVEPVVTETVETTEPEPTQQESGFDIGTQEETFDSGFTAEVESNPNVTESTEPFVPEVSGQVETFEDEKKDQIETMDLKDDVFVAENFNQVQESEVKEPVQEQTQEQMDMSDNVFVADEKKETPEMNNTAEVFEQVEEKPEEIEEARLLSFGEAASLDDIYFAFDSYVLDEKSKLKLRANAEWLKQNPSARIEIQGHCDERGTNNYNLGLGERRALSIRDFLIAQGVDSSRLHTISYGEEKPFCFESNENCWWQNRRGHFQVSQ